MELLSAVIERNRNNFLMLDLGTGEAGKNQTALYPPLKNLNASYITLDIGMYKMPDILGDASILPFKDETFDLVFAESLLEHVRPINKVLDIASEIRRVLKPGGLLLGWVPSSYPWHGGSGFADDIRFTWEGVKTILSPLNLELIEWSGGPISVFLLNFPINESVRMFVEKMESRFLHNRNYPAFLTTGFRFLYSKPSN